MRDDAEMYTFQTEICCPHTQVGRTKIITLHSGIWAANSTDRVLRLRLHIPTSPLSAPRTSTSTGRSGAAHPDAQLGPLAPGKGAILSAQPPWCALREMNGPLKSGQLPCGMTCASCQRSAFPP